MEFHEALGQGLIEGVTGVVGGQVKVIERVIGAPTVYHRTTGMEDHADITGHVLLGRVDEGVQGAFQRGEPQAIIDFFGPAGVNKPLVAGKFALHSDVFQGLVGDEQGDCPGSFVHLAGFNAHQAVFHHVEAAHTLGAGPLVELFDGFEHGDGPAINGHGHTGFKGDCELVRGVAQPWVLGVCVEVLGGRVP